MSLKVASCCAWQAVIISRSFSVDDERVRAALRRIAELLRILEPALAKLLYGLPIAISLTLSVGSNNNMKSFYVVTAHWVDVANLTAKSILLTILDVKCGTGVGQRV